MSTRMTFSIPDNGLENNIFYKDEHKHKFYQR